MLVSFKVRIASFDGKEGVFEEVLDFDFGELVIGCVVFVDFGNLCD